MKNKKEFVYKEIKERNIDICFLQEVDTKKDYPENLLTSSGYSFEVEQNELKVIKNVVKYERRRDLEVMNCGLVIVDINCEQKYRLINVYRVFNLPNNHSQMSFFKAQLDIIEKCLNIKIIESAS